MTLKSWDLLLMLLYSDWKTEELNEPILWRTRLLKTIIAFEKEVFPDFKKDNNLVTQESLPIFYAWNFWPMSKDVLEDLEFFIKINFIQTSNVNSIIEDDWVKEFDSLMEDMFLDGQEEDWEYTEQKIYLSEIWKKYVVQKIWPELSENQKKLIKNLKSQFNGSSLARILEYVYNNPLYAEYIKEDKSKIYNKYKI